MTEDDETDLPSWASKMFWLLVLVFNVAVFFSAVGVMVLYFEGAWIVGGVMLVVGGVFWAVGLAGYLWSRRRIEV